MSLIANIGAVAIGNRALIIAGAPGIGKSSLALALIDRGAVLIGDDGLQLEQVGDRLIANPPPRTAGLIEVRNLGLVTMPTRSAVPAALIVRLDLAAQRFVEHAEEEQLVGVPLPLIRLWPDSPVLALKAELALDRHGLR